jgi:hypothetical protein
VIYDLVSPCWKFQIGNDPSSLDGELSTSGSVRRMRKLVFLVAAAALSAACHNRSDEEVGAAPDQGRADTAAVTHVIDSTRTGPPGMSGRPGNATVTPDSVGADSAATHGANGASTGQDTSLTSVPQDTLGPRNPNSPAYPSDTARSDTNGMQGDSTGAMSDTTKTDTTSSNQ